MTRELELVELVTTSGVPCGSATVADAHTAPGQLHRAFSVVLVDEAGRVLLQRRAAVKTRFPLRWANACCGHPAPNEAPESAARRRMAEELDLADVPLTRVGVFTYFAADPATGRVEREYDHVLLGRVPATISVRADPTEVAEISWEPAEALPRRLTDAPDQYAPWLSGVLRVAFTHLS